MRALRRTIGAVGLTVATLTGMLALAQQPAQAATTWYVSPTGNNAAACTSPATACLTLSGALAKPGFADGDTINAAPGTYPMPAAAQRPIIVRSVTIQRDPAALPEAGPVVLDGGNVAGNSLVTVNAAGIEVTLRDLTIRNGSVGIAGFGPGLLVFAGSAIAEDVHFEHNRTPNGGGGAVAVFPGASFTHTGGTYTDNTAANGGALLVLGAAAPNPAATADLTGVTFTGNTANGGAIANAGNGGALYNSGATTVTDSSFDGNGVLQSTSAAARRGYGGAVFNGPTDAEDAPTLTLDGVDIGGTAPPNALGTHATWGGAVANVPLLGVAATGTTPGDLDVLDSTITGTTAFGGGGIYNTGTAVVAGSTITGTSVTPFPGVAFTGVGAGIYNASAAASPGDLQVLDTTISDGVATGHATTGNTGLGGGIFTTAGQLTLDGARLSGNRVTGTSTTAPGYGGGLLAIATPITARATTIDGNEADGPIAAGGGAFLIGSVDVDLLDGTVVSGNRATFSGGGILNAALLTVEDSSISDNDATSGGGLHNSATATLVRSQVTGNTATATAAGATGLGGGVLNQGGLTVTDSTLSGNEAVPSGAALTGFGGGLYNQLQADLTGSTLSGNTASWGGGVYNQATLTAVDTHVIGNEAVATTTFTGFGGGLGNGGTATFTGGSLSGNHAVGNDQGATGLGGGAYVGGGTARLTLDGVDVLDNTASGTAAFQAGWGGALYHGVNTGASTTDVVVDRSTFSGNEAVLGSVLVGVSFPAGSSADTSIRRSTISGNSAATPAGGTLVVSTNADLTLSESTLVGPDVHLATAGTGTAGVSGSILTGAPAACAIGAGSVIADGGHNLVNGTGCGFGGTTVTGDPQLGALAANGGPTDTHLPGPGSAALDQIDPGTATGQTDVVSGDPVTLCSADDQRGVARPEGARCDIGSVEVGQAAPVLDGPTAGSFTVGTAGELGTYAATGSPTPALSASGLPDGLTFEVTGPAEGRIVGTPAAGTGGQHAVTVTAENEAGTDSVEVTLTVDEAPTVDGPLEVHLVESVAGSADYTSTGYPEPIVSVDGALPSGVTFTPGPGGTGSISGTAGAGTAGSYPVTVRASNGTEPDAVLDVVVIVHPVLTITTTALPDGAVGVPYVSGVAVEGGTAPYTYSVVDGSLPAGLTLGADGSIAGIPQGPVGTSTFTVRVTDSSDPDQQLDEQELSITIGKGPSFLDVSPVILQRGPLGVNLGSVNATLRAGATGTPLAGQTIVFTAGSTVVCTGVTDANGYVSCSMTVLNTLRTILNLGVTATYGGNSQWLGSTDSAGLLV